MGGEPSEERAFRAIPERVGRFRVDRLLGTGGMASVYLAHEDGPGGFERRLALKFLHPHLSSEPKLVAQFVREAKIAAHIRHPNVVSVLEVGEHAGLVFLVMDYVQGESLASLTSKLGRQAIPLNASMRIVCDALAGLEAAHDLTGDDGSTLGIVHRDFSPQNLLIGRDGKTKLTDFGVAKIAAGTQHTQVGTVKGKIGYMAPEQARGRTVDRRTDVWAAGVVAWELVAGRRLYAGSDDIARLFDVATRTPPRLKTLVPDVPPELDAAIAWALTRKIDKRCPSAAAFRERLEKALPGGLATTAEVAELVIKSEHVSRSGVRSSALTEPEPALTGSLSASISGTESAQGRARSSRRRAVVTVLFVLTAAAAGTAFFAFDLPKSPLLVRGLAVASAPIGLAVPLARAAVVIPTEVASVPAPSSKAPIVTRAPIRSRAPAPEKSARRGSATKAPLAKSPYD